MLETERGARRVAPGNEALPRPPKPNLP